MATNITNYGLSDFGSGIFVQGFIPVFFTSDNKVLFSVGSCRAMKTDWVINYNAGIPNAPGLITVDANTIGVNGCYPRPLSAVVPVSGYQFVGVYAVGDASGKNIPGLVIATSIDTATIALGQDLLPPGYDQFNLIGFVVVDSTGTLMPYVQGGVLSRRRVTFRDAIPLLVNGNSVTPAQVFAPELFGFPPASAFFRYSFTPAAAGNVVQINIGDMVSLSEAPIVIQSPAAATSQGVFDIALGVAYSFNYSVTSASDSLSIWLCGIEYDAIPPRA